MEGYLGHWPARGATVAAAHRPDVQVPPDEGTWFQRTARWGHHVGGDRTEAARFSGLLPPLAPAQVPGASPSPPRLQGLLGTGPAPERCSSVCVCVHACVCVRVCVHVCVRACVCACACVSLVDTLTRVDTGSQVTVHSSMWEQPRLRERTGPHPQMSGSAGQRGAQGSAALARPWILAARICPFPVFLPSICPSRGGERVHSR